MATSGAVASGEAAEAVLSYGVVRQLTAAAVALLPGALAGLERRRREKRRQAEAGREGKNVGMNFLAIETSCD